MSHDPLKGYRGLAREKLAALGVRVWGDVRIVNDRGSVFEGVVLPRGETFDDLHVVVKLKTGYNVGLHVERIVEVEELGFDPADEELAYTVQLHRTESVELEGYE